MKSKLLIALSKGRILKEELKLLERIEITPQKNPIKSRKLVFETSRAEVSILVLRGSDVVTYVRHGIADIGMVGKDVLIEQKDEGFYEPLDLGIGKCSLMVAGLENESAFSGRLKIATKFTRTAKRHYALKGQQVDIIRLLGAMELAPVMGLAHRIVDIVETGETLKANGLVPIEEIIKISTKLIVNESSYKTKFKDIKNLINELESSL